MQIRCAKGLVMSRAPRLFHLLSLAARRASVVADGGLGDLEISQAQAGALFALPRDGSASISDIAAALQLAQSAASTLVQRMERAGLVARETDPADARVSRLRLTPHGEAVRAEAVERVRRLNRRMAASFSASEIDVVARWLAAIADLEPAREIER
jgi:DNA-binding MarR family transcriptional regulator